MTPEQAEARARLGGTLKARRPNRDRVAAARRDLTVANAEAYITRLLVETPPLSEEDKAHLSRLLTDPRSEAPTAPDGA